MKIIKKLFMKAYLAFLRIRWHMPKANAGWLQDSFVADYKKKQVPYTEICKIHWRGFAVPSWYDMGLYEKDYRNYLSDAEYFKMHPINGKHTKWIDDKLTLKYFCAGTSLDAYMPAYYYQIADDGRLLCLPECPDKKQNAQMQDVAALLKKVGTLAIKQVAGAVGAGFYKAAYQDGMFYLSEKKYDEKGFIEQLHTLRNYLIIEYLRPHAELARFSPDTPNCIRYLVARVDGELRMIESHIRFGTHRSGFVDNYGVGGISCYLDKSGNFTCGHIGDESGLKNMIIYRHPDTGVALCGRIPLWEEMEKAAAEFGKYLPQLKYMGMDFVITSENQVKVLEINSLPALDSFQEEKSIFETEFADFYRGLMK